jgi:hypothetical protein
MMMYGLANVKFSKFNPRFFTKAVHIFVPMTTKLIIVTLYKVYILLSTETGKSGSKALKERYCITYVFQSRNFSTPGH